MKDMPINPIQITLVCLVCYILLYLVNPLALLLYLVNPLPLASLPERKWRIFSKHECTYISKISFMHSVLCTIIKSEI